MSISRHIAIAIILGITLLGTLILRDANSTEISRASLTILPMGQLSRYARELFTIVPPGEFDGKIEVVSTLPVVALTLRQRDLTFTSQPVIP